MESSSREMNGESLLQTFCANNNNALTFTIGLRGCEFSGKLAVQQLKVSAFAERPLSTYHIVCGSRV